MNTDGASTRENLMDAAEGLILDHGFAGTTVDAVLEQAGVSKGAFFYHFDSKSDLGHALVQRYARRDAEHLQETLDRAERLSRDPVQQLLIFVALFEEEMEALTEPYPGCLFASYCYQARLFDEETLAIAREAMVRWRERVSDKLEEAVERHSPRISVDIDHVADMLMVIFEGAFVLSQTLEDPSVVAAQLRQYRNYLELIFAVEESP